MTTNKKTTEKVEQPINKDVTVRQYFYIKGQKDKEYYIKALERTHSKNKKSLEEWDKIMKVKNINF